MKKIFLQNGRRQHYHLGRRFREIYKDFFTTKPTEVDALSNRNPRCLSSAESNFASFFSPKPRWQFEEGLSWQPIPIISIPFVLDEYIGNPEECPAFQKALIKQLNTPSNKAFNAKHKDLYDYLSRHSGAKIDNYLNVKDLYETLYIEEKYKMIIPDWLSSVLDEVRHVYNNVFVHAFNSTEIQRLRAGPLLGIINNMFEEKMNGTLPELKFRTYSAHDDNIAVVLAALDLLTNRMIPYCSTLIFELYTGPQDDPYIRLLFMNTLNYDKYDQVPEILTLPGCQEYCPYTKYLEITQPFAHLNFDNECQIES
ncbi:lysosomal acid phosphatase [Parasteatoda tepidariorum]|uniref:lysosomal acid phosphatase n=1 Tax=Parasteatoda tepidariorum TaxID=114398 RepID=UPI001C71F669|nr:lysosomal acid phosphatase isoform X1 [Parasteatoda tepidariorum]